MCRSPVTAITLLRAVGTVTGDIARSGAIGAGYVFTVDNLLKMLSITLRLEVKSVLGTLGVSCPTQIYTCSLSLSFGAIYSYVVVCFEQ